MLSHTHRPREPVFIQCPCIAPRDATPSSYIHAHPIRQTSVSNGAIGPYRPMLLLLPRTIPSRRSLLQLRRWVQPTNPSGVASSELSVLPLPPAALSLDPYPTSPSPFRTLIGALKGWGGSLCRDRPGHLFDAQTRLITTSQPSCFIPLNNSRLDRLC